MRINEANNILKTNEGLFDQESLKLMAKDDLFFSTVCFTLISKLFQKCASRHVAWRAKYYGGSQNQIEVVEYVETILGN